MTNLYKADASIATSQMLENPSDSINPTVGMKNPGAMPKKKKKYRASKAIDATTMLKDMVVEGDFVILSSEDETYVGIVQYVMTEGMFGISSSDYVLEASMENPVILIRTLELEEEEGVWQESEYLMGAKSTMVTKIEPLALEVEVVENESQDSEMAMAMYDAQIGKQAPCWDGYVQRGMKPGADGSPVPNCVPAAKLDSMFAGIGKDYTRSTTNVYRTEE